MGGTLVSRVTGMLREILLVALFPVRASDAFRLAWLIPNLFRELLAEGALTSAFIPSYQRLPREERRAFTGAMLAVLALINAALLAAVLLAAPWIVDLLLAHQSNVDRDLAVHLLRLTFPLLLAVSLSALLMGVLNAEERFFAPAWAPTLLNIAAIAAMLSFPGEPEWLALGVVFGGVLQAAMHLPALWRARAVPRFGKLWHSAMPLVLALMVPFAFTAGARQLLHVVAQRMLSDASVFPPGAVTAYALATMLFGLLLGVFAISPAIAFYSRLSHVVSDEEGVFGSTLAAGVRFILALTIPTGAAAYTFSEPAVRTLFELLQPAQGQDVAIGLAAQALAPLGIGLPAAGLANYLLRPYFVRQRVLVPVLVTLAFSLLTLVLYLVLTPSMGIAGISWAKSVGLMGQSVVLIHLLHRSEGLNPGAVYRQLLRVGVVAFFAAWLARSTVGALINEWQLTDWTASLVLTTAGGATMIALLLVAGYTLRFPELRLRRPR